MTRLELTVSAEQPERAIDLLAEQCSLPKGRLKDAMNKGAVWLKRGRQERRLRRASQMLQTGDQLQLYYDPEILGRTAPVAECLADARDYSIWNKPTGLLSQGSRYGDHCSLTYQVERWHKLGKREVHLVHRLDREAQGLVLLAHNRRAAAALGQLWQQRTVEKHYQAWLHGLIPEDTGEITQPLDGRPAQTVFEVLQRDPERQRCEVAIRLITGRKHQIRRHFAAYGHPLVGDPLYGKGDGEPLSLRAVKLAFRCPLTGQWREYSLRG